MLAGEYAVVFRPLVADRHGEYLGTARRYYGPRDFSALVMFLPDREHRMPWQEGYDFLPADEALSAVEPLQRQSP